MPSDIAFEATGLVCLLVCVGIFDSQVTIMFFDKGIDAIVPTLATYAAALLAPVPALAFGARRAVAVSACALGLATAVATLVRAEWIEVFAGAIGFIAGAWWLALVAGSRVPGRTPTLAISVPVGIAAAFAIRAAARTLPLDGAPPLVTGAVMAMVLGVLVGSGRRAFALPRQWAAPAWRDAFGLTMVPLLLLLLDLTLINGAAIAGAAGLALGASGAASTFVGELAAGIGIAAAFLLPLGGGARRLAAIATLLVALALTSAHLGTLSLLAGALAGFGALTAISALLDVPTRDTRSPLGVSTALGLGWLAGIAAIAFFTLRFGVDPVPQVVVAAVLVVVAAVRTRPDRARLSPAVRSALAALAIIAPGVSLVTSPAAIVVAHAGPLRLMTYNVHLGYDDADVVAIDRIAAVIRAESPDLVALVEVPRGIPTMGGHDLVGQLAERLRMRFAFGPTLFDVYGLAILSRVPIDDVRTASLARAPGIRDQPRAVLLVRAEGITFGATHLGGDDIEVQAQSILDAIGGTGPVVVAGDMNSTPGSPQMRTLAAGGLTDLGATGNAGTVPGQPDLRIDYLWGRDVTAANVHTVDTLASDHLPVIADVTVR